MAVLCSVGLTSSGVCTRSVLLNQESRHSTFVTHGELYRYNRLMFGVTSAPEKYQQVVRDVLRGCEGIANIAGDLVVYSKGVEEHDRCLFSVLDRVREVGLTVNGDKCAFRLRKPKFFGHELSSDGVNSSEEMLSEMPDLQKTRVRFDCLWCGCSIRKGHARHSIHIQTYSRFDQGRGSV